MANMGDSPTLMLNAPVPAARKVLEKAGLTINDIDLFEINEARHRRREIHPRPQARPGQGQREWRRDGAWPSHRRHWIDPDRHDHRRAGASRSQARPCHNVRRRRDGSGDHCRAYLVPFEDFPQRHDLRGALLRATYAVRTEQRKAAHGTDQSDGRRRQAGAGLSRSLPKDGRPHAQQRHDVRAWPAVRRVRDSCAKPPRSAGIPNPTAFPASGS